MVVSAPTPLLNTLAAGYGTKYDDHLLEQYKLYVDSSQKLSDRRLSTNSYLFTINSSLLTVLGVLASLLPNPKALVVIPAVGCLLSLAWAILLTSFKRLNSAKFTVIHEMEKSLPANVYAAEWDRLVNVRTNYSPMSDVERLVPLLFLFFYVAVSIFIWNLAPKSDKPQRLQIESPVRVEMTSPFKK